MTRHARKFHSLSRRIVIQFCIFTLVISVVYGFISFVLMYTLEDSFIEKGVIQEANYLSGEFEKTGQWPSPRSQNIQLHFSKQTFPEEFRALSIEEPLRSEFYGEQGRHYHVLQFPNHPGTYLVAEVSNDLLVRPIREGVIQFLIISGLLVTFIACLMAWFCQPQDHQAT